VLTSGLIEQNRESLEVDFSNKYIGGGAIGRGCVQWNASDPWTIVSVSDDCESNCGGGTLQARGEGLEELEKFKSYILGTS
ncbi:hypothetical protein MKW98_013924, partial [Papaver atlanticum]